MKHGLTIGYITTRPECEFQWFLDAIANQRLAGEQITIIIVRGDWLPPVSFKAHEEILVLQQPAKPNVWQGAHRLTTTEQQWWAVSSSKNTAACCCFTPWIAFSDDRCVPGPLWLQAIREAMEGNYLVGGSYSKNTNLVVQNGVAVEYTPFPEGRGLDPRKKYCDDNRLTTPMELPKEWLYGCTFALPLEWYLSVGGHDETCDGLSMEDCIFSLMLANRGYARMFDPRLFILEDRTPGKLGQAIKREDFGVSPKDKSHALLDMLKDRKTALHPFDIRQVRRDVLAGKGWPKPWGPEKCFFTGTPVSEMR